MSVGPSAQERSWTLEAWQQAGKTYHHRGCPIFYREAGQGPALALLHGFPTASWDWHRVWEPLSRRFHLIAPDMIGFGFSAKPQDYAYSIFDQADLHEALLLAGGIQHVHILAHDYGDTVAQELLARQIDRQERGETGLVIHSVCLLNGGLFPETHRPRLIQRLLLTPLGGLLSRWMNEPAFRRSFTPIFGPHTRPNEAELADFWALIAYNNGARNAHRLIRYMQERDRNRSRWVGALQITDVPLLLVNGPLDSVSGAHMAARYRELVPNPEVVSLEGIGHYPQVEAPEAVIREFLEFHQRIQPAA